MDEDVGIVARPRRSDGIVRKKAPDQIAKIATTGWRFKGHAVNDIKAVYPCEMDENIAVVSPAKDKPRVAFIGNATWA